MKILTILLAFFILNQAQAKKFYKWVDDDGNAHYSEKKPNNTKTEEVKTYVKTPTGAHTSYQSIKDKKNESQKKNAEEETQDQKDVANYNKKEKERVQKAQNKVNCNIAKKNLATLQATVRVRQKDPTTGEYIRMDDSQRIGMIKKAKETIKSACK